jgi:hypothetical protein
MYKQKSEILSNLKNDKTDLPKKKKQTNSANEKHKRNLNEKEKRLFVSPSFLAITNDSSYLRVPIIANNEQKLEYVAKAPKSDSE